MKNVPIRMLSIDDKTLTTDLDRAGYRKMGVTVRSATTFKEAEKIMADSEVDILVINYDFDKADAIQIAKHLKTGAGRAKFAEIPVVITSVQGDPKTKRSCLDAGADLFVEQPLPRQYFIEKLRKLLEQKTRETERVNSDSAVTCMMDDGESWSCPIGDVSMSGILLATDLNIKPGTIMDMTFSIDGYKKPIRVSGEVVRRIAAVGGKHEGLGVRFDKFHGDSQKRLEKYVTKSHSDDPRMVYYL